MKAAILIVLAGLVSGQVQAQTPNRADQVRPEVSIRIETALKKLEGEICKPTVDQNTTFEKISDLSLRFIDSSNFLRSVGWRGDAAKVLEQAEILQYYSHEMVLANSNDYEAVKAHLCKNLPKR